MLLVAVLAWARPADAPCAVDIPDDLVLRCVDGIINAYSASANQRMEFSDWRCQRMQGT
jgi:hypothetical protein